jgi:hypothetical protein
MGMKTCFVVLGAAFFSCLVSAGLVTVDADSFANGADLSTAFSGVVLSSTGGAIGLDGKVYASANALASTDGKVFANNLSAGWLSKSPGGYAMRADFSAPTDYVSIDIIGDSDLDIGVLTAYDASGKVLTRVISSDLGVGQHEPVSVQRFANDIAYVTIGGLGALNNSVLLDHLVFNIPEPATMVLLSLGMLSLGRRKR